MRGTHRYVAAFAILWIASACGTGNTNVDPGDLELRDLLGVAPEVATSWDAEQRSSARRVVANALDDEHPARDIEIESYRSDDQLVRALTSVDNRRFDAGDDALAFVRVSGSSASQLSVLVAPLPGAHPFPLEEVATAILLVADPEQVRPAADGHLRALYGLTKAEARVAQTLLDADRLADVADSLGVTLSTVRTHLQRAFDKTDTRRQSELVRLLLAHRLPAIPPLANGALAASRAGVSARSP